MPTAVTGGDEHQYRHKDAAQIAEDVLHISVQDCRAILSATRLRCAAGAEFEHVDIDQRQTDAGDQAGPQV